MPVASVMTPSAAGFPIAAPAVPLAAVASGGIDLLSLRTDFANLRDAVGAVAAGRQAIDALAAKLGFTSPPPDAMVAQSLVGWVDFASRNVFIAPSSGWKAPSSLWQPVLKVDSDWIKGMLGKGELTPTDPPIAVDPKPVDFPPERPERPERPEPPDDDEHPDDDVRHDDDERTELPWSLARDLTEDEWIDLREAASLLREGREAVVERATELGFKPPAEDAVGTHVLVGWINDATGEMFVAPGGGWTPPDDSWQTIAKLVPPNPIIAPPERPEPGEPPKDGERPEPPEEGERPELPWSLARDLTEDEWIDLREAASLLREGREAVAARADELGFKPPAEDAVGTHVLLGWINDATGEMFVAPGGGWTPPDDSWQTIAKLELPEPPGWGGSGKPPHDPDVDSDPEVGEDDSGVGIVDDSAGGSEPADPVPAAVARPDPKPLLGQMVDAIHMIGNALTAGSPIEGKLDLSEGTDGSSRVAYEWRVGDKVIEGATSLKLPMMPLLAGRDISVKVSLEDSAGALDSVIRTIDAPQAIQSAAGKLMHWARVAERKADADTVTDSDGAVDESRPQAGLIELPAGDRWEIEGVETGRFAVRASAPPEAQAATAISASDALAALKLAYGRNPNVDPDGPGPLGADAARPFQLIAADIDGNGVVDRRDVQDLMGDMFDSATAAAARQRWLFVPERAHLEEVSRNAVYWEEPVSDPSIAEADNWIGVMLGDIDGSWGSDLAPPTY